MTIDNFVWLLKSKKNIIIAEIDKIAGSVQC